MTTKNFLYTARNKLEKFDSEKIKPLLAHLTQDVEFLLAVFNSLKLGIIVVSFDGSVRMSNRMAEIVCGRPITRSSCVSNLFESGPLAYDLLYAIEQKKDFDFKEYTLIIPYTVFSEAKRENESDCTHQTKFVRCAILPFVEQKPVSGGRKTSVGRNVITGSVICIEDIGTAREMRQREYRDKSFLSMRHITSSIAHELKNPLGAISLHLQLMRRKLAGKTAKNSAVQNKKNAVKPSAEDDEAKLLSYVEIIEHEIQTMDKVVSVFLNDFKVQQADLEQKNIHEVLESLLAFIAPDMKKNQIRIVKRFKSRLPNVLISSHAVTHLFLNIIKNAMDAMATSGTITIATAYENGKVRVIISDTGAGIPGDIQKQIFDPYFTTKNKGSGIGLTVACRLARLHGGDIVLDVAYSKGASFIITFPAYADEQCLLTNE